MGTSAASAEGKFRAGTLVAPAKFDTLPAARKTSISKVNFLAR
jgi:hypothetical protein